MLKLSAVAPLKGLLITRRSLKYLATTQLFPLISLTSCSISAPKLDRRSDKRHLTSRHVKRAQPIRPDKKRIAMEEVRRTACMNRGILYHHAEVVSKEDEGYAGFESYDLIPSRFRIRSILRICIPNQKA